MAYVERFSDRVDDYAKYRPTYPVALLDLLESRGLSRTASVMDVGSGTGILTALLLDRAAQVFAVEPNEPMRKEAERQLEGRTGFHSVAATAESTGLAESSVDLITAGQAFHWFDVEATKREWRRVGKDGIWCALIWNERVDDSDFSREYGQMARGFVDEQGRAGSRMKDPSAQLAAFFDPFPVERVDLPNYQELHLDGLVGRALSSSYWPKSGPAHEASIQRLEAIFKAYQQEGKVRFDYRTEVYLGRLP